MGPRGGKAVKGRRGAGGTERRGRGGADRRKEAAAKGGAGTPTLVTGPVLPCLAAPARKRSVVACCPPVASHPSLQGAAVSPERVCDLGWPEPRCAMRVAPQPRPLLRPPASVDCGRALKGASLSVPSCHEGEWYYCAGALVPC